MKRNEVWWVEFDPRVGSEIRKTRPAVVVSNDVANCYLARVVVLPLTSNIKKVYPSECLVTLNGELRKIMADQIMTVDKQRLKGCLGALSEKDMLAVELCIKKHLGIV